MALIGRLQAELSEMCLHKVRQDQMRKEEIFLSNA
jgi:hypothetical protein